VKTKTTVIGCNNVLDWIRVADSIETAQVTPVSANMARTLIEESEQVDVYCDERHLFALALLDLPVEKRDPVPVVINPGENLIVVAIGDAGEAKFGAFVSAPELAPTTVTA